MKILLAVDGSKSSLAAVRCLIEHVDWYGKVPEVQLVTVHLPVPQLRGMGAAVGRKQLQDYYRSEGEERLASAKRLLEGARIRYTSAVLVGPVAETLVEHARKERCDIIYIGTRGMNAIGKALVGSTASKVMHISTVPVLLVK